MTLHEGAVGRDQHIEIALREYVQQPVNLFVSKKLTTMNIDHRKAGGVATV
jgi:hypothetical protein